MAVTDRHGTPIAATIARGERHETQLVAQTLRSCFASDPPPLLIGDKAYDSDPLDVALLKSGVELVAPHIRGRKKKTQDGRRLRRYKRRWRIERCFAWLKRFRRLVNRWEHKAENFLGFVRLGCAVILLRRLRDAF
jgi:transposase